MERRPVETLLVGPNALLREGLARILSTADFQILVSSSAVDDCILRSLSPEQSVLLIIDVSDDFDAAVRQIGSFKQRYPAGRVAVLAHQRQLTEMVSAFRAGANAYFVEVETCDAFIKSLELVMLGETVLPRAILAFILDQHEGSHNAPSARTGRHNGQADGAASNREDDHETASHDDDAEIVASDIRTYVDLPEARSGCTPRLSARQQSILSCLIQGDSNKTIARNMNIAEATVKVHVKAILRKIRVHNRTQAAIWAMINGRSVSANDGPPLASPALSIQPSPSLDLTIEREDVSQPSPALNGASRVGLMTMNRFVRKTTSRKNA